MSYMLEHTAEQLDSKLKLIDENKNLLEYPYTLPEGLPQGLEDVGDGSFLTTDLFDLETVGQHFITTVTLPAGTYTPSLTLVNVLKPEVAAGIMCSLILENTKTAESTIVFQSATITLDQETAFNVYLYIYNGGFATNIAIRPQIEKGEVKTAWVPNMDKIGTYVDRRFNSLNAKIKVLTDLIEKLGLPDCTGMPEGTMLVVKNGAWSMDTSLADGEVLLVEEAFQPITYAFNFTEELMANQFSYLDTKATHQGWRGIVFKGRFKLEGDDTEYLGLAVGVTCAEFCNDIYALKTDGTTYSDVSAGTYIGEWLNVYSKPVSPAAKLTVLEKPTGDFAEFLELCCTEEGKTITFTIDEQPFTVPAGYTWRDFVDSTYNNYGVLYREILPSMTDTSGGYQVGDIAVVTQSSPSYLDVIWCSYNGRDVYPVADDAILEGVDYWVDGAMIRL